MTRLFDRPIAHRGLHDRSRGIIENSRSAFEAAVAHGYGIECDVQLSSDGVPFIFHDDTLERLTLASGPCGALPIAEIERLELRESSSGDRPQRFADFLTQFAGRTTLQIELKHQTTPERTAALAARVADAIRPYRDSITLESFDPRLLLALRRVGVGVPLGIILHRYDRPSNDLSALQRFALRHLLHWPTTRFDFISCSREALDLPAVRLLRATGMEVTAWTITSPETAQAARRGADQIVFEGFLPAIG